jgi:hypothetical protein
MFELIKSEVLPLTPDLARQSKEMDPSPTERDLNPARLKMLRDKADKGLLITFNWSTAVLSSDACALTASIAATCYANLTAHSLPALRSTTTNARSRMRATWCCSTGNSAFTGEDERPSSLATQFPKRPKFVALDRMH